DIFVALAILAAGNVGVCEFVHEDDGGLAGEDGVEVHFLEERAFVLDFLARDGFELGDEFLDAFATVGFDDADDHVFATAVTANGFAEHGESLADAGRVTQEELEGAAGFFGRRGYREPIFGVFRHLCFPNLLAAMTALELRDDSSRPSPHGAKRSGPA